MHSARMSVPGQNPVPANAKDVDEIAIASRKQARFEGNSGGLWDPHPIILYHSPSTPAWTRSGWMNGTCGGQYPSAFTALFATISQHLFFGIDSNHASHCTGSTRCTRSAHSNAPASATPPVRTKASRELPLTCTISPATQGATIPERFATPFCTLVHLPAIAGPANVWLIAQ